MTDADRSHWAAEDAAKRASRSIFHEFAIAMISRADPDMLPKVLQIK